MSQAKVEEHKEEKLHRKEAVKKQKRNNFLAVLITAVICCALVVWIGWSLYGTIKSNNEKAASEKENAVTPVDMSALTNYAAGILSDSSDK